jgi:hypothetical protein
MKVLLLSEALSATLRSSLAEVRLLWDSDLLAAPSDDSDNDNTSAPDKVQSAFTKRLVDICEKLLEARELLKDEEFDRIVELHGTGHFTFSVQLTGLAATPLAASILQSAAEEVLIIVAESRNSKSEKLLVASFEVTPLPACLLSNLCSLLSALCCLLSAACYVLATDESLSVPLRLCLCLCLV